MKNFQIITRIKLILLIGFLSLIASESAATHLIGGNFTYTRVGPDPTVPGNVLYDLVLEAYMDTNSQFWDPDPANPGGFPEDSILIGIMEGAFDAPGGADFVANIFLPIVDSNLVEPNLPPICDTTNFLSGVGVYITRYQRRVSLGPTAEGYWVIYDRCCRQPGIVNLNAPSDDQGFSYNTWIPPTNTVNSNPIFGDTLLSFICRGDTNFITNNITDPDGDSLVFSLAEPYVGYMDNFSPDPIGLPGGYSNFVLNPYIIPPPPVNWSFGFNATQFFGAGGFQNIDPETGLTEFIATINGIYVAAIEVREYRNNVLVGAIRRDIQLIVEDCPNNSGPNQDSTVLDSAALDPITYFVKENDDFCFNLNYDDIDGDPMELVVTGDIFDPVITNPPATVNSPVRDTGSVSTQICWNTSCNQGRDAPYIVQVIVTDSNCPPLPLYQTIEIFVDPFEIDTIFGLDTICSGNNPFNYSVASDSGEVFNWNVTGGTILSGNGSDNIQLEWDTAVSVGTVTVEGTNIFGCADGPISKDIAIVTVQADAGPDVISCAEDSIQIGGSPSANDPGFSVSWSPGFGLSDSTVANPLASPGVSTTYTLTVSAPGLSCQVIDEVEVLVSEPVPTGLEPQYFVCPGDSLQLNIIADSIGWKPNLFIDDTSITNPIVYPPVDQQYFIDFIDSNSCIGRDSTLVIVRSEVPVSAGPDRVICLGDSVQIGGNPTVPAGNNTYSWTPVASLNNSNIANPIAFPTAVTEYIVEVFNDTCTGRDSIIVLVNDTPSLSTSNDTIICIGDTIQIFAFSDGDVQWTTDTTLSNDTIFNPFVYPIASNTYFVSSVDTNGCGSTDSVAVDVRNLPVADAGDTLFRCRNVPFFIGGNPTGPFGSTYLWTPSDGLSNTTVANPLVSLDGDMEYQVQVTDDIGCSSVDSAFVFIFQVDISAEDILACQGERVVLSATSVNNRDSVTYSWIPTVGLSDSTSPTPTVTVDTTITYWVEATDLAGCADIDSVLIVVEAPGTASFTTEAAANCTNVELVTTNTSSGSLNYQWFVNNTLFSTEESPTIILDYTTSTTIRLVSFSPAGCEDDTVVDVDLGMFEEVLNLEINNVFTPNGDGINDFFEVQADGEIEQCTNVQIFNRFGTKAFETTNGVSVWDGRSAAGEPYPSGTYFYIVSVNGIDFKGTLTLLRD